LNREVAKAGKDRPDAKILVIGWRMGLLNPKARGAPRFLGLTLRIADLFNKMNTSTEPWEFWLFR